jgi:hypothetical protein
MTERERERQRERQRERENTCWAGATYSALALFAASFAAWSSANCTKEGGNKEEEQGWWWGAGFCIQ